MIWTSVIITIYISVLMQSCIYIARISSVVYEIGEGNNGHGDPGRSTHCLGERVTVTDNYSPRK